MKKRVGLKFGAVFSAVAALVLLVLWAISYTLDAKTAQFAFREAPSTVAVAVANGNLILCDSFANREIIGAVDRAIPIEPAVVKDVRWSMPGVTYRRLSFSQDYPVWSLSVSLVIPCMILLGLSSGLWIWRARLSKPASGQTTSLPSAGTIAPPESHDISSLDRAA
jgi:hypothetical protein